MIGMVLAEDAGDGVRVLTLNRPHRLNAIVPELLEDLIAALQAADRDPAVRAIVLTGAGRAFCAGDDLKEFGSQSKDAASTRAYVERIQDVTRAMVLGDTPVVGAIRGWAVGGGLEWVINCDFALTAEGTRFFFPEGNSTGPQLRPHPDDDTEGQTAERRRYSRLAANPA